MDIDTEDDFTALDILGMCLGIPSICGFLIIISKILFNRNRFSTELFLIFVFLLISCMMTNISFFFFFLSSTESYLCLYQSFIMVFADTSVLHWNLILVIQTYQFLSFRSDMNKSTWAKYIFFGFIFPLLLALFGLIFDLYGVQKGIWCWIKSMWFGGIILIIEIILYTLNVFLIFSATKYYKENVLETSQNRKLEKYYFLFKISWIQMFGFIFGVTNRLVIVFYEPIFFMEITAFIIYNSFGIFYYFSFQYFYGNLNKTEEATLVDSDLFIQ